MKKILALMLALIMIFSLGGCAKKEDSGSTAKKKIVIGIMPDIDSIPIIIAAEKGYFKEENITVEIQLFKSAMERDSALQSGNLDGTISDVLAIAFAKEGGFDLKITSATVGSYKLVAAKNQNASQITDLKGKDIAISKNTIIEFVTDKIIEEQNMKESDFKKVIIPQIPTRLEMLQNGNLAAATLPEPLASAAIHKGGTLVSSSDILKINPGVMIFTNKSLTEKEQEIKAFYRAYNKAINYIEKEPLNNYIDLLIDKLGFPNATKDYLVLPEFEKAALPTEKDFNDCIKWLLDKNLIKKNFVYQDLVDGRFVE
ncbi:MetQ/NlpA family ABC transporter substrate-binding protein [Selenomonadales bacterium OttesenSCG-928-I06]|nr:MetQ/NlpA family ABC transporter substrate-binding protein [Selenomonadales bacterium OttesenSCG-928-I06]